MIMVAHEVGAFVFLLTRGCMLPYITRKQLLLSNEEIPCVARVVIMVCLQSGLEHSSSGGVCDDASFFQALLHVVDDLMEGRMAGGSTEQPIHYTFPRDIGEGNVEKVDLIREKVSQGLAAHIIRIDIDAPMDIQDHVPCDIAALCKGALCVHEIGEKFWFMFGEQGMNGVFVPNTHGRMVDVLALP